jgi:hypothetical protein
MSGQIELKNNNSFIYFSVICSSEFYNFYDENHLQKNIQGAKGLHSTQSLRIIQNEINSLQKMQPITQQGILVTNMKRTAESLLH